MNKPFNLNPWTLFGFGKKEKLQAPFITVIQNPDKEDEILISWDTIENADRYKLYVDGRLVDTIFTNSTNYTFSENGAYKIYVKSYGGKDYSPSDKSNAEIIEISIFGIYLVMGDGKNILMNMEKVFIRSSFGRYLIGNGKKFSTNMKKVLIGP